MRFSRAPAAAGLDLGTTRIKAGLLTVNGRIISVISTPSPLLKGRGTVRESSARRYLSAVENVLTRLRKNALGGLPLGISTQRSTFLLWDTATGRPLTPLVSWQNRRADRFCRAHRRHAPVFGRKTGLLLSPHYAGAKLSVLLSHRTGLKTKLAGGRAAFGTLDTFVLWRLTGGRIFSTDVTMAARTLMFDIRKSRWSPRLFRLLGLPRFTPAQVTASVKLNIPLRHGFVVRASLSDQAAVAAALPKRRAGPALVNLGTGGFVLCPTGKRPRYLKGFLCGPTMAYPDGRRRYALEGTINGIGAAAGLFGKTAPRHRPPGPAQDLFCLPDTAGVGSPHWRPRVPMTFSRDPKRVSGDHKHRAVLEGILFRVREILDALCGQGSRRSVLLSGGLAKSPFIRRGLAALWRGRVELLPDFEASLRGAALLAMGGPRFPAPRMTRIGRREGFAYLNKKYWRWKKWLKNVLEGRPTPGAAGPQWF